MSKNGSQKASKNLGALFFILILLTILLAGIGFVLARNNEKLENLSADGSLENDMQSNEQSPELFPTSELAIPQPSQSAPLIPTAIATSEIVLTTIPLPQFHNPVDARLIEEAAAAGAEFIHINETNTGVWQYTENSFIRPISLEVDSEMAYLLDGGRVLALHLDQTEPPLILLKPGDSVGNVRVLEPLDLALVENTLFVLDRAGDVYRYDLNEGIWELDRYDRPVEASSGHYFVAIDTTDYEDENGVGSRSRTLLETNYKFVMHYGGAEDSLWNLPEARAVDVSESGLDSFVLQREMFSPVGMVTKYRDTRSIKEFSPQFEIESPREIVATETSVYVLDRNGQRLLALDPNSGRLQSLYQMPQENPISVFAVDAQGRFFLAGRDRMYWVDQPERIAAIQGGLVLEGRQPHDPSFLSGLEAYSVPIGGSNITFRDFQMPGAPRHYRLGVHHGLDFYWQPGTKVLAAADGVVIRADVDYVPPTAAQLAAWWNESQEHGYTSADTLDNYLGRQVWIQHAEGVVTRYAHLRSIASDIVQGVQIERGRIIGEVGNSGSPASLESEQSDAHLHFELWLRDTFLGPVHAAN